MLTRLSQPARAFVLILTGAVLASFLPVLIAGAEAASGGPTVNVKFVNGPVAVGGTTTQIGSLSLPIGKYVVQVKLGLGSNPNDVRVNCHLALGSASDAMSTSSTSTGVEVVMMTAGKLTSAGNAVVTCQTVPPVGGVDATGLKIIATKIGTLTGAP